MSDSFSDSAMRKPASPSRLVATLAYSFASPEAFIPKGSLVGVKPKTSPTSSMLSVRLKLAPSFAVYWSSTTRALSRRLVGVLRSA